MKGIDKITSRIPRRRRGRVRRRPERSPTSAARPSRRRRRRRPQEEYWRLVREGSVRTPRQQRVQRMDRTARLEAKKSVLNMKQEAVSRAFELARATQDCGAAGARLCLGFLARQAAEAAISGRRRGHILRARPAPPSARRPSRPPTSCSPPRVCPTMLTLSDATREMAGGAHAQAGRH